MLVDDESVAVHSGREQAGTGELQQFRQDSPAQDPPLHPLPHQCEGKVGQNSSAVVQPAVQQPQRGFEQPESASDVHRLASSAIQGALPKTCEKLTAVSRAMFERLPVLLECRQILAKGGLAEGVAAFDRVAQLFDRVEKDKVELDAPLQRWIRALTGGLNVKFS